MKIQTNSQSVTREQLDPLYDTAEAAAYLNLAENTLAVWRCTRRYDIPYIKVGRLVRYRKSALDAFLERRTQD